MAFLGELEGIRHFTNAPARSLEVERILTIQPVTAATVVEFQRFMHEGFVNFHYLSPEENQERAAERSLAYYQREITNPDRLFLAARDASGKIIGGLETETFALKEEGVRAGFIDWIYVDPEARGQKVGIQLLIQYTQLMQERGTTYIGANIHHTNTPSLNLHRRAGLRFASLEKPEGSTSRWYSTGQLPLKHKGGQMPITEVGYFPDVVVTTIKATQEALREHGLGEVDVNDMQEKNADGSLINIIYPDRQSFENFFAIASNALLAVDYDHLDPAIAKQAMQETVKKIAKAKVRRD